MIRFEKKELGDKKFKKKIPDVLDKIEGLMEYETAGDPMSNLKWTKKTTEKISKELASINITVSKTTVGKILKKMGFSLKSNSKKISNGGKSMTKNKQEERNQQFIYINKIRKKFRNNKLPVISVDNKKTELIGNFKNAGTRYKKIADLTNDHDFNSYGIGKAGIYGIFDESFNQGFVCVGQQLWEGKKFNSGNTPEFAVESIKKWWENVGKGNYPHADEILILADSGGSNGYKPHMWKLKLQELLCIKHGLKVTVCHYPPGASKWNPIEHRLFSEISKNWQGTPLRDYETVLKYIRTTTTNTGLKVKARLIKKKYIKGKTVSKEELKNFNLHRHKIMPLLNYSLCPN